jgi:hypothetical protein
VLNLQDINDALQVIDGSEAKRLAAAEEKRA